MTRKSLSNTSVNPNQLEAIEAVDGPVLIIAGPGSGKTFTLVERIVHLIIEKKIAPESLLVVTFTDKAARELTTRISNRLSELEISFNLNEMYLGTFHSICLRVLEEFREFTRLKRSFTLFDQFDQQFLAGESHVVHGDSALSSSRKRRMGGANFSISTKNASWP